MIDGVKPRADPLLLRRVIMNGVPQFGTPQVASLGVHFDAHGCIVECAIFSWVHAGPLLRVCLPQGAARGPSLLHSSARDAATGDPSRQLGCCPYLQLFKGGKLVFTAAWQSGSTSTATHSTSTPGTTWADGPNGFEAAGDADGPAWAYPSDLSVAFAVDTVLQVRLLE